jgi:hypothetical protein
VAWPKLADRALERRCTAQSQRKGRRCGNYALHGANVCVNHGGKAPQVKARAAVRWAQEVEDLKPKALRELEKILDDELVDERAKIKAAEVILDRTDPKLTNQNIEVKRMTYHKEDDPEYLAIIRRAQEIALSTPPKQGRVFDVVDDDDEYRELTGEVEDRRICGGMKPRKPRENLTEVKVSELQTATSTVRPKTSARYSYLIPSRATRTDRPWLVTSSNVASCPCQLTILSPLHTGLPSRPVIV